MKYKKILATLVALQIMTSTVNAENIIDFNKPPVDQTQIVKTQQNSQANKKISMILGNDSATVNGQVVKMSSPAISIDGRTYLPLRFLAENILGISPKFDSLTKEITIESELVSTVLTLNSKLLILNGEQTTIDTPPLLVNNNTLLPLRFFVDNFDLSVSYDAKTKEVVVKNKPKDINPPISNFKFTETQFVQGQTINFQDLSYDPDGDKIIKSEWIMDNNPAFTTQNLNELVRNLEPGEYKVGYRVQNDFKNWSEWSYQTLVIVKNEPPTASNFRIPSNDIGIGEVFEIYYTVNNEPWEKIVEEHWTYRHENVPADKAKKGKPFKLFTPGNYIATLQLKDAYGNLSEEYKIIIPVSTRVVETQLHSLGNKDMINTPLENFVGINFLEMFENIPLNEYASKKGLLLMSDSPENVTSYGILYEDYIYERNGRMLINHVNKIPTPKDNGAGIVIVVENMTGYPVNFSFEKTGMMGPSDDPLDVGAKVLDTHFNASSDWGYMALEPGERKILFDSRRVINWKSNQVVSMLSEFATTGNVKITFAAVGPTTQLQHIQTLPYLPKDQHPRGTFYEVERSATINIPGGKSTGILIGKDSSEWIEGKDGVTGKTVYNRGNYGVEHRLTLNPEEDTMLIINCRGGSFRGHIGWPDGFNRSVSSYGPDDARFIGIIKGGESTTIRYMLANGSSSPVQIGFIPKSLWDKVLAPAQNDN